MLAPKYVFWLKFVNKFPFKAIFHAFFRYLFFKHNLMRNFFLAGSAFAVIFTSCNSNSQENSSTDAVGVDIHSMDKSHEPCSDFYLFANGSWINNNPIPETESKWSNFNVLRDKNDSLLRTILEKASKENAAEGTNTQKIGAFYKTAMDTLTLDKEGLNPLKSELKAIQDLKTAKDVALLSARYNKMGMAIFYYSEVYQDAKNSKQYTIYNGPGGLGLPDRDYYLVKNPKMDEIRGEYSKHVTQMFQYMGYSEADALIKSASVMKLETRLAKISLTKVEQRDPNLTYNKFTFDELNKKYPQLFILDYKSALGFTTNEVVVSEPKYLAEVNQVLSSSNMADIKTYVEWCLINNCADKLSQNFDAQNFYFYSTVMKGVEKMKPRWKRVLQEANGSLGELLGQEYVKVAFSPENKKKVNEMVDHLMFVMEKRIKNLDWMTDSTKKQALKKLSTMGRKLGYPDKWKDYSTLKLKNDAYVLNWFRCNEYEFAENVKKLGRPIDKTEWFMPPQTVNAYYNPLYNEIVFPAGILQPPFFDIKKDDAINYGSMGAVIGHEITHGFDDSGNKFDAEGNLKDWWTAEDRKQFEARAKVIIDQYNGYEVLDSVYINGALTLGENIADIGGLSIAFEAYLHSLEGKEKKLIDGFTPEQRFFISFGQVWKNVTRPEALREQVMTDPHSPAQYRVVGTLSNLPEFEKAFGSCSKPGFSRPDSLKAKIW